MVSIDNFTWRLGNQLFQIAAAVSLAESNNDEVSFPQWDYSKFFKGNFTHINSHSTNIWKEQGFHFTPIPYSKNISINGYFQSEKYFIENESKIREIFTPKDEIVNTIKEKHSHLFDKNNLCAIHVRRGDYVNLQQHHPLQTLNYYIKATKKFPNDTLFLIFSDDTNWCKENFPPLEEKFQVIEGQSDIEDFVMMSMCDHAIIGNSSFSWWSAWLNNNPNKIVCAPSQWFGPAYSHFDTKDLYCKDWIII